MQGALLSLGYRVLRDAVSLVRPRKPPTIEERVAARTCWKSEFEAHLRWIDDSVGYGETIIRDVRRADAYPDLKERRGISPWFRAGIVGLYHRGVEIGLRYTGVHVDRKTEELRLTEVT